MGLFKKITNLFTGTTPESLRPHMSRTANEMEREFRNIIERYNQGVIMQQGNESSFPIAQLSENEVFKIRCFYAMFFEVMYFIVYKRRSHCKRMNKITVAVALESCPNLEGSAVIETYPIMARWLQSIFSAFQLRQNFLNPDSMLNFDLCNEVQEIIKCCFHENKYDPRIRDYFHDFISSSVRSVLKDVAGD